MPTRVGALQVEQDGRRPVEFLFERSDMLDQLRLLLLVAVTYVDPERVGAGKQQAADRPGIARSGAKRRQDLHLARARRECFGQWLVLLQASLRRLL